MVQLPGHPSAQFPLFAKSLVIRLRFLHLPIHEVMEEGSVFRAVRAAQDQPELVEVGVQVFHERAQVLRGQGKALVRPLFGNQVEMGVLRGFESIHEPIRRLSDDVLEEGRFVRVIPVECALREPRFGDDPVQRRILEAFLKEFPLPDL